MKRILWFTAGVIAGIAGVFLREVFGKAAMPTVDELPKVKCPNCGNVNVRAKLTPSPFVGEDVTTYYVCWTCLFNWYECDAFEDKPDMDKTQPIKVR